VHAHLCQRWPLRQHTTRHGDKKICQTRKRKLGRNRLPTFLVLERQALTAVAVALAAGVTAAPTMPARESAVADGIAKSIVHAIADLLRTAGS
jgi:hypothetical protein